MTDRLPRSSGFIPDKRRTSRRQLGQFTVWCAFAALMILIGTKLYQVSLGPVSKGKAPDFTLTTFEGESYTLSDYVGQVIVINFWASWCGPCALEAPDLERAWRKYKDHGVLFLGIDYVDTEKEAQAYLQKWGVTYPNGADLRTKISQAYRIKGVPETYIINQNGIIAGTIIGPIHYTKLTSALDSLLKN